MKLHLIQSELKAPKGQTNEFGGYKYRSCEDIVEAVKPILFKHGFALVMFDEIVETGGWHYVKAIAEISDGTETHRGTGFAREQETKKGMDASQITGAASSYARKYALNGLLAIDDTKDADHGKPEEPERQSYSDDPKELVCHVGKSTKGLKLRELTAEQIKFLADKFEPKTDKDRALKEAATKLLPDQPF